MALGYKVGSGNHESVLPLNSTERLIKLISPHTHTTKGHFKANRKSNRYRSEGTFKGIAATQKTLLVTLDDFKGRIGIDRAQSTYKQAMKSFTNNKQFLREEYHVRYSCPDSILPFPPEALNFFFRVKRKIKPRTTVKARIVLLNRSNRLALHRKLSPVRLLRRF